MSDLKLDEEHPLALELSSLRDAVLRYQHEAHAVSLKLQRHSLDASHALEHTHALEQENVRLREELETLRAHPDTTPQSAALQVPELTLALRKLSDKLTHIEQTLLLRTTDLAHAQSELGKTQDEREAMLMITQTVHARLDASASREREWQRKARSAEEERKLADAVLEEYAALVRKLEGRSSISQEGEHSAAQHSPSTSFSEGKSEIQKFLGEFSAEHEQLVSELSRARSENELLRVQLEAERRRSEADRESLGKMITELDQYRADDSTAAKMVSRYMKFSQSTTDSMQKAMDNLRMRHAATLSTLNGQIEHYHRALMAERRQTEKLREALDQLSEDISREAYGRRREISLRLAFLGREESLAEHLRRWVRKSKESSERTFSQAVDAQDPLGLLRATFDKVLCTAENLLETLNGQPATADGVPSGSLARIIAAEEAVRRLTRELQDETHLRLQAQGTLGHAGIVLSMPAPHAHPQELPMTPPQSTSSVHLHHVRSDSAAEAQQGPASGKYHQTPERPSEERVRSAIHSLDISPAQADCAPSSPPSTSLKLGSVSTEIGNGADNKEEPFLAYSHSVQTSSAKNHKFLDDASPLEMLPSPDMDHMDRSSLSELNLTVPVVAITDVLDDRQPEVPLTCHDNASVEEASQPALADSIPLSPVNILVEAPPQATASPATSIQELSGLDIRDLPSAAPQPTPQPPDNLELAANGATSFSLPLSVQTSTGTPSGMLFTPSSIAPTSAHPLISDLQLAKQRYDSFQRAFRDCNLSLKDLKKDVAELSPSLEMSSVLRTAVERLNDFNEDTRVELEIRVSDEERIISGYETLLAVPGAMSDEVNEGDLQQEIGAFVEGTASSVAKALQQFSRKLDDLQHDIASIKRALHELASGETSSPATASTPTKSTQGWSSWTGGILGGGRPVSPAPTFGSVMTTPRVRQSSFGSFMHRPSLSNLRDRSVVDSAADRNNPFASLDLRIPMPALAIPQSASPSRSLFLSAGVSTPAVQRPQKNRATPSPMYMLGLGMRSNPYGFSVSSMKTPQSKLARSSEDSETGSENGAGDSDVE